VTPATASNATTNGKSNLYEIKLAVALAVLAGFIIFIVLLFKRKKKKKRKK